MDVIQTAITGVSRLKAEIDAALQSVLQRIDYIPGARGRELREEVFSLYGRSAWHRSQQRHRRDSSGLACSRYRHGDEVITVRTRPSRLLRRSKGAVPVGSG